MAPVPESLTKGVLAYMAVVLLIAAVVFAVTVLLPLAAS